MTETLYRCSVPLCNFEGKAEQMWNLPRRDTAGALKVICGRHAHDARKHHSLRAYRLADTIRREEELAAKRLAASQFFAAFRAADNRKKANKNEEAARRNGKLVPASAILGCDGARDQKSIISSNLADFLSRESAPAQVFNYRGLTSIVTRLKP